MPNNLSEACDAIEGCYEFMLAYAAQGAASDDRSESGGPLREYLQRATIAIAGITDTCRALVAEGLLPTAPYEKFFAVLERDARDARAAIDLVLAQRRISSQLIDNLNASSHLKALLTDVFLIDEIFDSVRSAT
jgi:hypothetical protein